MDSDKENTPPTDITEETIKVLSNVENDLDNMESILLKMASMVNDLNEAFKNMSNN